MTTTHTISEDEDRFIAVFEEDGLETDGSRRLRRRLMSEFGTEVVDDDGPGVTTVLRPNGQVLCLLRHDPRELRGDPFGAWLLSEVNKGTLGPDTRLEGNVLIIGEPPEGFDPDDDV